MTSIGLAPEQIRELSKCAKDAEYFIETFCWLEQRASAGVSDENAVIPFEMGKAPNESHFFQRKILRWLKQQENVLTLKSRRVGCSWIAAAYAAWLINFHKDVSVLFISRNGDAAKRILSKVKFVLKNLAYHDDDDIRRATSADWLLGEKYNDNLQHFSIGYRNTRGDVSRISEVVSLNNTDDAGRGDDATFVVFDELAFYEHADETWSSAIKTLARGGHWMAVSTPSGIGDVFHRLCSQAELAEQGKLDHELDYKFIKIHWTDAGITEEQVRKSNVGSTEELIQQEWEFHFLAPGTAAFHPTHLAACYKPTSEYPDVSRELAMYQREVVKQDGRLYYFTGVDSAVGKAHRKRSEKDWNAFVALTKSGIQACAYADQKPLSTWAGKTVDDGQGGKFEIKGKVSMLHEDWPGFMQIEEEGPGYTVINNYESPRDTFSTMKAVSMKHQFKRGIIERLIIKIEAHAIAITDLQTFQQLQVFQRGDKPGQFGAPPGYNDDLVMSLALASDGIDQLGNIEFSWGSDVDNLDRASIVNIMGTGTTPYERIPSGPKIQVAIPENSLRDSDRVESQDFFDQGDSLPYDILIEDLVTEDFHRKKRP